MGSILLWDQCYVGRVYHLQTNQALMEICIKIIEVFLDIWSTFFLGIH